MFEQSPPSVLDRKYKSTSSLIRPARFKYDEPSSKIYCDVKDVFSESYRYNNRKPKYIETKICFSHSKFELNETQNEHSLKQSPLQLNLKSENVSDTSRRRSESQSSSSFENEKNTKQLVNEKWYTNLSTSYELSLSSNSSDVAQISSEVPVLWPNLTSSSSLKLGITLAEENDSISSSLDLKEQTHHTVKEEDTITVEEIEETDIISKSSDLKERLKNTFKDEDTVTVEKIDETIRAYLKSEQMDKIKPITSEKHWQEMLRFNSKQMQTFLERKKNIELDILSAHLASSRIEDSVIQENKTALNEKLATRQSILNTLDEMKQKMTEVKLEQRQLEERILKEKQDLLIAQCKQVQGFVNVFKRNEEVLKKNVESCSNVAQFNQDGKIYMEFNRKVCAELTNLVSKCKNMTITQDEVSGLSVLMNKSEECFAKLKELYSEIEDEVAQQRKEKVKLPDETPLRPKPEPSGVNCASIISPSSLQYYKSSKKFFNECETLLQSLLNDSSLKSFRFQCQKAFNMPINAINAVDKAHLLDKYKRLVALLRGDQVIKNGNTVISATSHPQGVLFCQYMMAKKFVSQVDLKPEVLFAYASVIITLWQDFPDFGVLLLAEFHNQCPYLIPAFWPQLEGQSNEEYYKLLGYVYKDGQVEKQDLFLKRMSKIIQLYAAITVTAVRSGTPRPHPHNLKFAWRWLAAMLNTEPQPDICATLIFHFLKIAGNAMSLRYKKQFFKLTRVIQAEYLPKIKQVTPEGQSQQSLSTLSDFIEKVNKSGCVAVHPGQLPPNFWQ